MALFSADHSGCTTQSSMDDALRRPLGKLRKSFSLLSESYIMRKHTNEKPPIFYKMQFEQKVFHFLQGFLDKGPLS